jgi:hypothetical protein
MRAHKTGLFLACIFLAGWTLRVWGTSSAYQRIDDIPVAKQIFYVYQGDWSPDPLLFYPIFFCYIVGVLLRIVSWFLSFLGVHGNAGLFEFTVDQVLLAARLVSATMGALTILIVFKIARKLFSEAAALAAAFFLAVSFVHILYSHQIVLDVPMTFFYAAALYFCVLILKEGRWPHYLAASFFAGLATATKYNGIFIVFSLLLAHIWKKRETQKNILKILFHGKILTSGFITVLAFFLGHPYALLWFNSFIRASKTLARLVHETEWYLVLIKPGTLVDKIAESNYVKGLGNVLTAEGVVFFLLILLGFVGIFYRRKKETSFISLSGLIYFMGALGFLGFSRLRDLSTLALFYAFIAAFGLVFLSTLCRRRKAARAVFVALTASAVVFLSTRSVIKTYYLWEDDTTEIAERWIKRNISAGSQFGREWFTPEIKDPGYKLRSFTRPYLIWGDFPSFHQFDFIMASSASYGHFFKYRKYYPDQVAVYSALNREHELLKDFYFAEVEFKNPEVKIYSGKDARRPKQRISLPSVPADPNPVREFEIVDGTVYGKDINSFFLSEGENVNRIFISKTKLPRLAVFIRSPESDGTLLLRNGLQKRRIVLRKGKDAFCLIQPQRSFPFYKYIYKVEILASHKQGACFVKLCYDDFDIGLEFLRLKDYARAYEHFLLALENPRPGARDLEVYLHLARCARLTGRLDEERRFLERFFGNPLTEQLHLVYRALVHGNAWERYFEKLSGVDISLFQETQTLLMDDDQFLFEHGTALEPEWSLNGKAWMPSSDAGGEAMVALSSGKRWPPQTYKAEFIFYNPSGIAGNIGEAEIILKKEGKEETLSFPLRLEKPAENFLSRVVLDFTSSSFSDEFVFRLQMAPGTKVAFDCLRISPDLRAFLKEKYKGFEEYLEKPQ